MYIDIHNHTLFHLDDGAKDITESMEMLEIAKRNNITTIMVTPHFHPKRGSAPADKQKICMEQLQEEINKRNLGIQLYSGNEIYFRHGVVALVQQKKINTLANSRYVLIEFSTYETYETIRNALYEFLSEGFFPIVAHIERMDCLVDRWEYVNELIEMGAYMQINIQSIREIRNLKRRKFLKNVIKSNMVHFLATDSHNCRERSPEITKDVDYVRKKFGSQVIELCMIVNPQKIIQDEII